jgi:hypothetical protein
MKLKKTPRYLAWAFLTIGASLIIGFLSFGGMYALWPLLPLASAGFGLSVAYEGEIYLQNIKGAWNKLFKRDYLKHQLANDYLLQNFPDTEEDTCPQFFKDYETQLDLLHTFGHKHLNKASLPAKKQTEKTLRDMEKWFALQLFADNRTTQTTYERELRDWLDVNQQTEWKTKLSQRQSTFRIVKAFSTLAALFMGLGTTYLLVEAFSVIPMISALSFALWPALIIPMALIAGVAYGLLTYNAVTDMISNDTLRQWYYKLRQDFSDGLTVRNIFIATTALILMTLAVGLTICTAGTWWTVAQQARPLFAWMGKMPGFIMGVINPIITGLSAVVFNLQNSSETLTLIDNAIRTKGNVFARTLVSIKQGFAALQKHENWAQMLNPFRLLLTITIVPLRILFFLGHLISIGVTADRMPGVSQILSALLGIISEGFEDYHYFFASEHDHEDEHNDEHNHEHGHGHEHGHDHVHADDNGHEHAPKHEHQQALRKERLDQSHTHNHDLDLPTVLLKITFSPIYFMAASWDCVFSKRNANTKKPLLSLNDACYKQLGIKKEETITLPNDAMHPSVQWQREHAIYRIERYKEKHLYQTAIGVDIAQQKIAALTGLQHDLCNEETTPDNAIREKLTSAAKNETYGIHRFFNNGTTKTASFIDELPQRINLRVG